MTDSARSSNRLSIRLAVRLSAALALLLLAAAAPAAADCIPFKVPVVIAEPGSYCLVEDFEGPLDRQTAIAIESDHVILDLQGHLIRNTAKPVDAIGGVAVHSLGHSHIVVRNGSISGFWEGVVLTEPSSGPTLSVNHLVEGLRVYDCRRLGIGVEGNHSIVRGNVVYDITGENAKEVTGILAVGNDHRVLDNQISRVLGASPDRWGIRLIGGFESMVFGNQLHSTWNGVLSGSSTGYRDNLVVGLPGAGIAYSGGVDLGGNVVF